MLEGIKRASHKSSFFLNVCRGFAGHENDIRVNIKSLAGREKNLRVEGFNFGKLKKSSNADSYAYLISKDTKNKISSLIKLKIADFEKFLKK